MALTIAPCPFCGSEHLHIHHNGLSHCVVCESCKTCGPHSPALENAIGHWNQARRPTSTPDPADLHPMAGLWATGHG
ncbi:Lar family restriction alleviation protein [Marinimicrobium alkaliphilum]|uniref:Lar family restriction alleviation protein n=1 Tax=Marinimicrobium alkaliphilum TaxID=2202654 RepID=UPI000DBA4D22|nr:Lar family restriction alleviation protein [Marinimicrobium alkaliphilum]